MSGQSASEATQPASAVTPLHFKSEPELGSGWSVALVFVLVLAALGGWLVRRYGSPRATGARDAIRDRLMLKETVWVAPKLRVSRLQCDGRTMLLASSPHGLAWLDLGESQLDLLPGQTSDQEKHGKHGDA